jgi:Endonuclease-reverse transcriptase
LDLTIGCCYRPPRSLMNDLVLFDEMLTNISMNNDLILLGDFNINLNCNTNVQRNVRNYYKNMLENLSLFQIVKSDTHNPQNSSSLIDHIIVSNINKVIVNDQCSFSGISHHDMIYLIYNCKIEKEKEKSFKFRDFNNQNKINEFQEKIVGLSLDNFYQTDDVDIKLDFIENVLNDATSEIFPEKQIIIRKNKPGWLTKDIQNLQKERDFIKRRFNKTKSIIAWKSFQIVRNKICKLIRNSKKSFFELKINQNCSNSKELSNELKKLGIYKNKNENNFNS